MGRLVFIPFSLVTGLIAGLLGKRLFELAWRMIDKEEAPEAEHREVSWGKLAVALALEGAIFRLVRGLADHASRIGYERFSGEWPGEEEPEPA